MADCPASDRLSALPAALNVRNSSSGGRSLYTADQSMERGESIQGVQLTQALDSEEKQFSGGKSLGLCIHLKRIQNTHFKM